MQIIYRSILVLITASLFTYASCNKDNTPPQSNTLVPLSVEFDNIVGGMNLQLNTGNYTNPAGENYSITDLRYFVSNFQLTKSDGSTYTIPQDSSYFLITEASNGQQKASLVVPEGDYTRLKFVLGVDSLRSTMDLSKRTGALDPAGDMESGMYWGWNSGYIFFKMEGISPAAPLDASGQHKYRYHIGGFGGYSAPTINNTRTVTLDLTAGGTAKPRSGRSANIHLMVDVSKLFDGNNNIATHPTVMFSEYSTSIADRFPTLFRHDHTEN